MKQRQVFPCCIFFFLFSLLRLSAFTQKADQKFFERGWLVGYANTFTLNTKYKVLLLAAEYSRAFGQSVKNDFAGWYGQPQFNLVKATNTKTLDVEFGLNLGIRNYIRINPKFYFYQMLGSGPHFISARLSRQARGFIFSDNLAFGSLIRVAGLHYLNLQAGVRHISNANLKLPNRGVNSYVFMIGYSLL